MKTEGADLVNILYNQTMDVVTSYGLTKREYFAAMAMQGILCAQAGTKEMVEMQAKYYAKKYPGKTSAAAVAIEAVLVADELIKALNETPCNG